MMYTPEEQKRIDFLRDNAIELDPDGYDTELEIKAALERTFHCIECGKPFVGEGRLCSRCYCDAKF